MTTNAVTYGVEYPKRFPMTGTRLRCACGRVLIRRPAEGSITIAVNDSALCKCGKERLCSEC
jgi:hypothetical protein